MSKKSKTRRAEFRKKIKASRKAQARAQYEAWKRDGSNKKSKRNTLASKRGRQVKTKRHLGGNCGNVGCSRESCFPDLAAPKMNDSNDPRVRFRTLSDIKAGR